MPPATAALIAANVGMFLIAGAIPQLMLRFALWPIGGEWMLLSRLGAGFAPWQLVTYSFLHVVRLSWFRAYEARLEPRWRRAPVGVAARG